MAKTRQQKEEVVERVKNAVSEAGSVTFVNFHGLNVVEQSEMRSKLRENGVNYFVAKKTLTDIALKDSKVKGDKPTFEGELAIATSADETGSAREIYGFQKKFEDKVSILGGIFDGEFKSREEMTEIGQIPGTDVLRGMFLNVINSPIQGLVIALSAIAETKTQ